MSPTGIHVEVNEQNLLMSGILWNSTEWSMKFYGITWHSMGLDAFGFLLTTMRVSGGPCHLKNARGAPMQLRGTCIGFHGSPWISMGLNEAPWKSMKFDEVH